MDKKTLIYYKISLSMLDFLEKKINSKEYLKNRDNLLKKLKK